MVEYSYTRSNDRNYNYSQYYEKIYQCRDYINAQKGSVLAESSLSGNKLPGWRGLVKRGLNATTNMTAYEQKVLVNKPALLDLELMRDPNFPTTDCAEIPTSAMSYGQVRPFFNHGWVYGLHVGLADNAAKTRYVRKMRAEQTSFQGGIFAGEIFETARLLKSRSTSLRRSLGGFVENVKKRSRSIRKNRTIKKREEELANLWLEQSFGWSPLLNDIDEGMQTVANSLYRTDRDPRKMIVGVGWHEDVYPNVTYATTGTETYRYRAHFDRHDKVLVKYQGLVNKGSHSVTNLRRVGLDVHNFLPTVWELIPYSFLVDYFSNVGEIVSALSHSRSDVLWTNRTVVQQSTFNASHWYPEILSPTGVVRVKAAWPGKAKFRTKLVTRTRNYTGTLIPSMEISTPDLGTRWLNIAALLRSSKETSRLISRL